MVSQTDALARRDPLSVLQPVPLQVDGAAHCMAIVRGLPENIRIALSMVREHAGEGRLGQDSLGWPGQRGGAEGHSSES